jgi:hypothetical protein
VDVAPRTEQKRSRALAVVVVFLAVLFVVSQFGARGRSASRLRTASEAALARLEGDVARLRAAVEPVRKRNGNGSPLLVAETARFVDDADAAGLSGRDRTRLVDHASRAVVGVCEQCSDILQAARPPRRIYRDPPPQHEGLWARKMIGLAP